MTPIILDISHYRLFKPVKSNLPAGKPNHFMKVKFLHKGIDAINLKQLLRSQSVMDKIPAYFKDKELPIISYQYANTVQFLTYSFKLRHYDNKINDLILNLTPVNITQHSRIE